MQQNEYYLKDHMVEDPIAGVKFPKFAAAATLERGGKTYYFIGEKTRGEFEKQGETAAPGTKGTGKWVAETARLREGTTPKKLKGKDYERELENCTSSW